MRISGRYAVSILAEGMEQTALDFAGRHDPELAGVLQDRKGLPVVPGAVVHLWADVLNEVPAGDHTRFIGLVRDIHYEESAAPLLFYSGQFMRSPNMPSVVAVRDARAQCSSPVSLPAKSAFFLPREIRRISRSTVLSSSIRPSSRKRVRPAQ